MDGIAELPSNCKAFLQAILYNIKVHIMKNLIKTSIAILVITTGIAIAGGGDFSPQEQRTIPPHPHDDEKTIVIVQEHDGHSTEIIVAIIGAFGIIGAAAMTVYLTKKKKS